MKQNGIIYVHKGEWPSNSPSIVFVTGTVYGLAAQCPATLIIRNNSEKDTGAIFKSITGREVPDNLHIVRLGSTKKKVSPLAFYREAVKIIGNIHRESTVRGVISRNVGFLPFMLYIKKSMGIPCFFETHDYYGDLSLRKDLKKGLNTLKNHWYERIFLPRINGLICLSAIQSEIFRKRYPGIKTVIANTGLMEQVNTIRPDSKTICYIGSTDTHKGLNTVLSALTKTSDKNIRLLIIGGKNEREKEIMLGIADEMGLSGRVNITGWIDHSGIGDLMDNCMAGIVPLTDTPFNRYITSPLKIMDYFSRSLPVIASNLPATGEYIQDGRNGFLFTPEDPENLAMILDRYFSGELFSKMSKEIELTAKKYRWENRGTIISEFIDSCGNKLIRK